MARLIDLKTLPTLVLDLRYATLNNFTGTNLYQERYLGYLHEVAAAKLVEASRLLQAERPGCSLRIFDALRPRSMQRKLFAFVKGTPQEQYVADPELGSIHSYGMAVDLTLNDSSGAEVDMGTEFDAFHELAHPKEEEWLRLGRLNPQQFENRMCLKRVMLTAGFVQSPIEWWHFNALPSKRVRAEFQIIEDEIPS